MTDAGNPARRRLQSASTDCRSPAAPAGAHRFGTGLGPGRDGRRPDLVRDRGARPRSGTSGPSETAWIALIGFVGMAIERVSAGSSPTASGDARCSRSRCSCTALGDGRECARRRARRRSSCCASWSAWGWAPSCRSPAPTSASARPGPHARPPHRDPARRSGRSAGRSRRSSASVIPASEERVAVGASRSGRSRRRTRSSCGGG